MKIEDIKTVYVHWSESELISKSLGYNEDSDINKEVDKFEFDALIKKASSLVGIGFDKTVLTITMSNGEVHEEIKFNLTTKKNSLVKLIKDDV